MFSCSRDFFFPELENGLEIIGIKNQTWQRSRKNNSPIWGTDMANTNCKRVQISWQRAPHIFDLYFAPNEIYVICSHQIMHRSRNCKNTDLGYRSQNEGITLGTDQFTAPSQKDFDFKHRAQITKIRLGKGHRSHFGWSVEGGPYRT